MRTETKVTQAERYLFEDLGKNCSPQYPVPGSRDWEIINRLDRYPPNPYVPPTNTEPEPVLTIEMKRYIAAGGFTTFCVVVMHAAAAGAFTFALEVAGWVVGGAIAIRIAWAVLFSGGEKSEPGKHGQQDQEWEFYQRQEQGWRKKD